MEKKVKVKLLSTERLIKIPGTQETNYKYLITVWFQGHYLFLVYCYCKIRYNKYK